MQLQANGSFANYRMAQSLSDEPRQAFIDAVRCYANHCSHGKKARLIEAVIRNSRALSDDDEIMPKDLQLSLSAITQHFQLFASGSVLSNPTTYRQARRAIQDLFF